MAIALAYKGEAIECGFRADLIVDDCVVVEIKAVETLSPVHAAQMLTYLKLTGRRVVLLINFNSQIRPLIAQTWLRSLGASVSWCWVLL